MPSPRDVDVPRACHPSRCAAVFAVFAVTACGASGSDGPDPTPDDDGTHGAGADTGHTTTPGPASTTSIGDDGPGDDRSDDATASDGGGDGLGPAQFEDGELDPASHGGTITFGQIGAAGWYPSRRDPAVGPCDAYETDGCCMAHHEVAGDQLTPWDEDLVLTLRGPMLVKQLAVYQPGASDAWTMTSGWTDASPDTAQGLGFHGDAVEGGFSGAIGTECLVDVSTDQAFACGPGSEPYCPASSSLQQRGFAGSKLFVILAAMPHVDAHDVGLPCSEGTAGNWWDAPWMGLSLGELSRAGAFSDCQCYAKDPTQWWLADGCGQFNVFEVVNDNDAYRNLDVFSTNFFGYAGYVGEGPCGTQCDVGMLAPEVDLIDKSDSSEAAHGAEASPTQGPGAAFRRPTLGYRYFVILLHADARTVQLAMIHPLQIPPSLSAWLPELPFALPGGAIDDVLALRLPQ